MITLAGITRKVGADTLTWLWPWMRDEDSMYSYESTVYKRRFRTVEEYKEWVGNIRWGLAKHRIMGFSLLAMFRDYATEVNPGRTSIIVLDHGILLNNPKGLNEIIDVDKRIILEESSNLIMDVNSVEEGMRIINDYRCRGVGLAIMVDKGQVVTTSAYAHSSKPSVNTLRIIDL